MLEGDAAPGLWQVDCPSADELVADRRWWSIYEESFPSSEREPPVVILDSLRRGLGLAFRARQRGVTVGLATTHLLVDPPAVFLVYLAIAPDRRGRGAGGALFQEAWRESSACLVQRGLAPLGLIWEVDPAEPGVPSVEVDVRARRLAFFRRQGGVLLPRPYAQPPVDGIAPVRMQLMFRAPPGGRLPSLDLEKNLIRAIYFEKYSALNGIDQAILRVLLEQDANR